MWFAPMKGPAVKLPIRPLNSRPTSEDTPGPIRLGRAHDVRSPSPGLHTSTSPSIRWRLPIAGRSARGCSYSCGEAPSAATACVKPGSQPLHLNGGLRTELANKPGFAPARGSSGVWSSQSGGRLEQARPRAPRRPRHSATAQSGACGQPPRWLSVAAWPLLLDHAYRPVNREGAELVGRTVRMRPPSARYWSAPPRKPSLGRRRLSAVCSCRTGFDVSQQEQPVAAQRSAQRALQCGGSGPVSRPPPAS